MAHLIIKIISKKRLTHPFYIDRKCFINYVFWNRTSVTCGGYDHQIRKQNIYLPPRTVLFRMHECWMMSMFKRIPNSSTPSLFDESMSTNWYYLVFSHFVFYYCTGNHREIDNHWKIDLGKQFKKRQRNVSSKVNSLNSNKKSFNESEPISLYSHSLQRNEIIMCLDVRN